MVEMINSNSNDGNVSGSGSIVKSGSNPNIKNFALSMSSSPPSVSFLIQHQLSKSAGFLGNKFMQDDDINDSVFLQEEIQFGDLIIVSNRLPMTITRDKETNEFIYKKSSGGLVTALTGMKGREFKWVGWTGGEVNDEQEKSKLKTELMEKYQQFPVFLSDKDASMYYDGFSNGILWPLFHYLYERNSMFDELQWEAYKRVNETFADAIMEIYKENDMVWVHDYHLMLLPKLLRQRKPDINIGFFLHIPFPSSEIYRILPVRTELLEGLLASNLVAFHTFDFARHFLSSCTRTLGCDTTPRGLLYNGIFCTVHSLPIGIDPEMFKQVVRSEECQKRINDFKELKYKGKRIVLGIDRLDYTKGVQLKFHAFEKFLTTYPEYSKNTVLIQVGVPTRQNVKEYQDLLSDINELSGRMNSTFGTLEDGFPVHFLYKSIPFVDLCALYSIADICLVTSVRDGMNLVSCEYVVCQDQAYQSGLRKDYGVLVLSEFAGAARSLGGSIIINPWDIGQTMKAVHDGLLMRGVEKEARHKHNWSIISRNTATQWGSDFMQEFEAACRYQKDPTLFNKLTAKNLPFISSSQVRHELETSKAKRLFIFDYDGTIVPLQKYPGLAVPSERVLNILKRLASDERNDVFIVTGRDQQMMTEFLGGVKNLGIASEHGVFTKFPNSEEWDTTLYHLDNESLQWIDYVTPIIEHVSSRTPGSFSEIKKSSIVFHYRNSDPDYGEWSANELRLHLEMAFAAYPMDIIKGRNRTLEIRPMSVSKGACVKKLIERGDYDFIFVAGDDTTDESMFEEAERCSKKNPMTCTSSPPLSPTLTRNPFVGGNISKKSVFSVVVGRENSAHSRAKYQINSVDDLLDVLDLIAT
ncbi:hypothetical protein ABK040_006701 [Willaertia magna]